MTRRKKSKRYLTPPFKSLLEMDFANALTELGIDYEYESYQMEYHEPIGKYRAYCDDCGSRNLRRKGWYTPDFYLPDLDVTVETKGFFTAAARRKMLAVKESHPDADIVMVFQSDNKLNKRSQRRYSDWCRENRFKWSIGKPLEEWTNA